MPFRAVPHWPSEKNCLLPSDPFKCTRLLALRMSVPYMLPYSLARYGGSWCSWIQRWLASLQMVISLVAGAKLLCGKIPYFICGWCEATRKPVLHSHRRQNLKYNSKYLYSSRVQTFLFAYHKCNFSLPPYPQGCSRVIRVVNSKHLCKIWGFHIGDYKECRLLDVTPCGFCRNRRASAVT
jgi:hypothetical protein